MVFWLFIFAVSAEQDGGNLTVSCRLTCTPDKCDRDVSLSWAKNNQSTWLTDGHEGDKYDANTLVSKLFTADTRLTGDPVVCSVYREGVLMASITWSSLNGKYATLSRRDECTSEAVVVVFTRRLLM